MKNGSGEMPGQKYAAKNRRKGCLPQNDETVLLRLDHDFIDLGARRQGWLFEFGDFHADGDAPEDSVPV